MTDDINDALTYFENAYSTEGLNAQRRFPNEELCRFMGRNFFQLPIEERSKINILEVGCGSGANLWMIAREGFNATGVDLSPAAIELCAEMLKSYSCSAAMHVCDMTDLTLENETIDAVVDVFSSHCLDQKQGMEFLSEVLRVLKRGGKFFSYFPSTRSDTWQDHNDNGHIRISRLDYDTHDGLHRTSGPFYGNLHPFRFLHPLRYTKILEQCGFIVDYCETVTRTYSNRSEIFEFVVIEGTKN